MKNPLLPLLDARAAVLLDGAMATELERRGADLSSHLWSARQLLDAPEAIAAVQRDYLEAGADVVCSATYQASRQGFARVGLSEAEADARLTRGVASTREVVKGRALVAASLGPYGAVLADGSEYTGDYPLSEEALADFHRLRVKAALEGQPDLVLFETIPSEVEARAILRLCAAFTAVPFVVTFSTRDEVHLAHGERFADVARRVADAENVVAVGVNCLPPERVVPLLVSARGLRAPLVASPNSGETWEASTRRWVGSPVGDFGALVSRYLDAGVRVVGGCCRTTPGDLAAARRIIDAVKVRGAPG
ncbi:MAG: homocysteine S-methyltransferase [Myxococcales bacterium]|nr:homocysteine S-methyltransferase [Myxococcales bacterium]